jgi:GntR family transcriptional regulator, transcriptional repressor for pyruvate dehydrogenase complex
MALTDDAINRIRAMILAGELIPGQRLPPERELGELLGLSKNSLREAVRGLTLLRVLDVRQGDGTYVTSLEPDVLLEALSFVVDLHQDASVLELLEVRRILETGAVGRAAAFATAADVERLREHVLSVNEESSVEKLVQNDLEFHRQLARLGGNAYLATLLDRMSSATVRARAWRAITDDNSAGRTLSEHRAILDALEQHDSALAQAWTNVHISGVERWLRTAME